MFLEGSVQVHMLLVLSIRHDQMLHMEPCQLLKCVVKFFWQAVKSQTSSNTTSSEAFNLFNDYQIIKSIEVL